MLNLKEDEHYHFRQEMFDSKANRNVFSWANKARGSSDSSYQSVNKDSFLCTNWKQKYEEEDLFQFVYAKLCSDKPFKDDENSGFTLEDDNLFYEER